MRQDEEVESSAAGNEEQEQGGWGAGTFRAFWAFVIGTLNRG